ncbi:MAG: YidC/Oxa1 family insertase periplasmic-domain containing protein [Planctomycetota bacterium]
MINFLLSASLFMMLYMSLKMYLDPPKKLQEAAQNAVENVEDQEQVAATGEVADASTDNTATEGDATSSETQTPEETTSDASESDGSADASEQKPVGLQRVVLGSLDPTSPYQMAVYFSNKGATIERIELNNPRYRELNAKSGYLGNLTLSNDPKGGCRIGTVAPGSPAADAVATDGSRGLEGPTTDNSVGDSEGDRIIRFNGEDVADNLGLDELLETTEPGQSVEVVVVRNGKELTFTATLGERPLSLISPEPLYVGGDYSDRKEKNLAVNPHQQSFLWTLGKVGDAKVGAGKSELAGIPSLWNENWQVKVLPETTQGQGIEFSRRLTKSELEAVGGTSSLELVKTFFLTAVDRETADKHGSPGYGLKLKLKIRNTGSAPQKIASQLDGPTGLPLEGWWYSYKVHPANFSGAGARDVICRPLGGKHDLTVCSVITKRAMTDDRNPNEPLTTTNIDYVGCDTQYFSVVLRPEQNLESEVDIKKYELESAFARSVGVLDEERKKRTDVSFRITGTDVVIPPGGSYELDYQIFAGPKQKDVLASFELDGCIVYGWSIVKTFAKPMSLVLNFLYGIVRSWGLAILLLTVMVRGMMLPLGRKMAMNAAKMQELAPEMKLIAEKYKDNMEKKAQAQRELFAKHNYNPLAGCPLMLLQFPVFVGLYRALSVDISLRQAPFFPGMSWCSNLAGPDQFMYWEKFVPPFLSDPTGWLGPYLNVLPLITCFLFILQQKLFTPPPQDEQQEMQQQVMKFMMVFMGVMFHKVAAGLCIYLIASSIWGICERTFLPKPGAKPNSGGSSDGGGGKGGGGKGGGNDGGGNGGGAVAKKLQAALATVGVATEEPTETPAESRARRKKKKKRKR